MRPFFYRAAIAIFVTALALPALGGDNKGFTQLFDGKTLNGWMLLGGVGPGYVPKDGILVCPKDGGGNLVTEKQYGDFIFRFDFRLHPSANNGVGIRTPLEGNLSYTGMEVQLLDDRH